MEDRQFRSGANASQRRAIAHRDGPAVVLAGPGSGKTFVITERVRFLIEQCGVPPSRILTITFTRMAAAQMRHRFLKCTDHRFPEAVFGTFHSVFHRMLQLSCGDCPRLVTEQEKRRMIAMLLSDAHARDASVVCSEELSERMIAGINRLKAAGRAATKADFSPDDALLMEIHEGYERMLRELGRMDFDDIMTRTRTLLEQDAQALSYWRERFDYLLIDEYQDINPAQSSLVKLLAAPGNNLFAVGDDDQSIYGFRGSDPSFMLDFADVFPGAVRYALEINYRCAPAILTASMRVIAENTQRFVKDIRPGRTEEPGEVLLHPFPDREQERAAILTFLHRREAQGMLDDTALIVRTNAQARTLAQELSAAGIAFRGADDKQNYYEAAEIADVLAYLRLAGKAPAQADFYRIMNRPQRYLSRECMRNERFCIEEMTAYYQNRPASLRTVRKFEQELKMLKGLRPALAIRFIRTQIGYDRHVSASDGADGGKAALSRLDRLQEEAAGYAHTEAFLRAVEEKRAAFSKERARHVKARGAHLLTMHAAKGAEFDAVWLPGLNEGTIPARRIVEPLQIEEERRLFYVAMTRAKRTLVLSWLTGDARYARVPSRFLRPLLPA